MLPILPILAIAGVMIFISSHAALFPPKKKKSPPDLEVALEKVIRAARKEEKKDS